MWLYKATIGEFIANIQKMRGKLATGAFGLGWQPSPSEVKSWYESLPKFAEILKSSSLKDCLIYLEYSMPGSSARCDILVIGLSGGHTRMGVVVELKQWDGSSITIRDGLNVYIGNQAHLHPSEQAFGYRDYLADLHPAFADASDVKCCSYLFNLHSSAAGRLRGSPYSKLLDSAPLFCGDENDKLRSFLEANLRYPPDSRFVKEVDEGGFKESKSLRANLAKAIHSEPAWVLLDEQRLTYNEIRRIIQDAVGKHLILVNGGPGTGKSVLAIQIMGEAAREGKSVVHVTNSRCFTTVVQSQVMLRQHSLWGSSAIKGMFRLSHGFVKGGDEQFDIAVCDEAHRFRKNTTLRWLRSPVPQAVQIMNHATVTIVFFDEKQIIRRAESGTLEYFIECAKKAGIPSENIHGPIELTNQFRYGGNKEFLNWVDSVLYGSNIEKVQFPPGLDLKVYRTIEELEEFLKQQLASKKSARLVAGFCWNWSDPSPDGSLVPDIRIKTTNGLWTRPWNRKAIGTFSPDSHPYTLWNTKPLDKALDEVGCIYSIQGFDFDSVGLIWGEDLVWRNGFGWVPQPERSFDKDIQYFNSNIRRGGSLDLLKNTYRVLLSRALSGCGIYCVDKETGDHLRELIKQS